MAMVDGSDRDRRPHGQDAWAARGWVAHHNTDLWRAIGPDRRSLGLLAHRRRMALPEPLGTLRVHPRPGLPRPALPGARGGQPVLPRHAGGGADPALAGHLPLDFAGERPSPRRIRSAPGPTMDMEIIRDLFDHTITGGGDSGQGRGPPRARSPRPARGLRRARSARPGQLQEWLEDWDMQARRPAPPARFASLRSLPECPDHRSAARRSWPPRPASRWRSAATTPPAGALPGGSTSGPGCRTPSTPTGF